MTDQPRRITPADLAALLDQLSGLTDTSPLDDQITWHERKALFLSELARALDSSDAHQVAAAAWHHTRTLAAQRADTQARTRAASIATQKAVTW